MVGVEIEENSIILYKYLSYEAFIKTVETWSLKASFPYDVNDPLENVIQRNNHFPVEFLDDTPKGRVTPFFSFSRNISTSAMWGLYAENGQGVCLVFAFPIAGNSIDWIVGDTPGGLNPLICKKKQAVPVCYHNERIKLPYDAKTRKMLNPCFANSWLKNNIVVKGKSWEYESEVRIFSSHSEAAYEVNGILSYEWPMNYLVGVVVGPKCRHDRFYIQRKIEICQNRQLDKNKDSFMLRSVIVTQARAHDKRFEYEAAPFFDKCDGLLWNKIVQKGLHHGLPGLGYFRNWNDRIIKIQLKLRNRLRLYEDKILSVLKKCFPEGGSGDEDFDLVFYFLIRSTLFDNIDEDISSNDLANIVREDLTKFYHHTCNSQFSDMECFFDIVSHLDCNALTQVFKYRRNMYRDRTMLVDRGLEKICEKFFCRSNISK